MANTAMKLVDKPSLPQTVGSNLMNRFDRHFLGFDDLFRDVERFFDVQNSTTFPPYNILKSTEDGQSTYTVELAVAGFSRDDLSVIVEDDMLVIKGNKTLDDSLQYVHQGIAYRNFERKFKLTKDVEVYSAEFVDGMLRVTVTSNEPQKVMRTVDIK
jgi:molecular chaperone IbpA